MNKGRGNRSGGGEREEGKIKCGIDIRRMEEVKGNMVRGERGKRNTKDGRCGGGRGEAGVGGWGGGERVRGGWSNGKGGGYGGVGGVWWMRRVGRCGERKVGMGRRGGSREWRKPGGVGEKGESAKGGRAEKGRR